MNSQGNKENYPLSAPPSYSNSMNAPNHEMYHQGDIRSHSFSVSTMRPPQPTQVIVVQGNPTILPPLGPRSVRLTCPSCNFIVRTRIEEDSTANAYLCCMLLFIVICTIPCSCVPFCMERFKVSKHSCPNCNAFIGIYKP